MTLPLQVTWRNVEPSDAVEADIRQKAEKLQRHHPQIVSWHAVVEAPHAHHHKGKLYRLHLDIAVPGKHISVTRDPSKHQAHEDLYVAVRDAFDAAQRQLQDYAQVRRGDVKRHG